jgi:hypothetical protein
LIFYVYVDDLSRDRALYGLLHLFDPGDEISLTTFFSVLNLLISSIFAYAIYRHARRQSDETAFQWLTLSILFFCLSLDESASIHERAGARFFDFVDISLPVIETHRWLLAGVIFTAIVGLFFIPFLLKLDARTRFLFLLSGGIFLAGALLFEFVGALMMFEGGYTRQDLAYRLRRVAEEGFELLGIAIFNCTLLGLIQKRGITLRIDSKK